MVTRCAALALPFLILALLTPSARADPAGSTFTIEPNPPRPGEAVTFTFVPPNGPGPGIAGTAVVDWDLSGKGESFETTGVNEATTSYPGVGEQTVRMRVTDDEKAEVVERRFFVTNPPTVDFDFEPDSPLPGERVLFAPVYTDPDDDTVTLDWDLGAGAVVDSTNPLRASYSTPGTRTVKLTATDKHGASSVQTRELTVRDPSGPTAAFTFLPAVPLVGEPLILTNTSTASSGSLTSEWDLDDDGDYVDSPIGWSFSRPGNHEVSLRVTQKNGKRAVAERNVRVNAAPVVQFLWSPLAPVTGQAADLISVSTDTEGPLAAQEWDLDDDGQFDDARGSRVTSAFPSAGTHDVGLRVTDSDGVVRVVRRAITVGEVLGFITPFPVVRLAGKVLPRAARVQVLAVRAPRGALVLVRCAGRGCPVRSVLRTSRGRTLRFPRFERRLRAGIRLKLFVSQGGRIGKYTSFLIRAGAAPRRVDRCLYPTGRSLRRCP
jgi:PKD repeat protein